MGLSYYYEFTAPATVTAGELEQFLKALEFKAKTLGFSPTSVLNVSFDTPERRAFALRLGGGYYVEDERLRGDVQLSDGQVDHHNAQAGAVRLVPVRAVVLAVTDAAGCESCFGFMQFPDCLVDESGVTVMHLPSGDNWMFKGCIDTPDPRFRAIVREFEQAGYLALSKDEFARADSVSRGA
jgi:hypothetical protein